MLSKIASLRVVQDIVEWGDYRRIADVFVQGSEGFGGCRTRIISCINGNSEQGPEYSGDYDREKAKRSVQLSVMDENTRTHLGI